MSDENDELTGLYTIKNDKFLELTRQTERSYYMAADMLQDQVVSSQITEWDNDSTKPLMLFFLTISEIREFLNSVAKTPDKDLIRIAKKNNIKDILIRQTDLVMMNALLLKSEQMEQELNTIYKITFVLN